MGRPVVSSDRGFLSSLLLATLVCSAYVSAAVALKAHPVRHRHERSALALNERGSPAGYGSAQGAQQGYKTVGYYASWDIYARNWPPQNIPASQLTHVLYAFAGIDNQTGACYLTDTFADVEKKYPGDEDNSTIPSNNTTPSTSNSTTATNTTSPTNLYGNLKQLYLLKKQNRNLKTLLSIGGWGLRESFAPGLSTPDKRQNFARTSVQLLSDLGFDGLDIDWEYPNTTQQSSDLVDTCIRIRLLLDELARNLTSAQTNTSAPAASQYRSPQTQPKSPPHFLLTLSVPAGPDHFPFFPTARLSPAVDFLNLMAYDYAGPGFSDYAGHQANMYKSVSNPRSTNFSTADALNYYLAPEQRWDPRNLILGAPLYGRSFAHTSGPGTNFSQPKEGSWEAGTWDYKALYANASFGVVCRDAGIMASWSWENATGLMVSFDDVGVAREKARFVRDKGLGGMMWWELSGDVSGSVGGAGEGEGEEEEENGSLIAAVKGVFEEAAGLERKENWLGYGLSRYANLRAGMM